MLGLGQFIKGLIETSSQLFEANLPQRKYQVVTFVYSNDLVYSLIKIKLILIIEDTKSCVNLIN